MLFKKRLSILSLILCLAGAPLFAAQQPDKVADATTPASAASATPSAESTSSVSGANKRKIDDTPSTLTLAAAESDNQSGQSTKRLKTDKDAEERKEGELALADTKEELPLFIWPNKYNFVPRKKNPCFCDVCTGRVIEDPAVPTAVVNPKPGTMSSITNQIATPKPVILKRKALKNPNNVSRMLVQRTEQAINPIKFQDWNAKKYGNIVTHGKPVCTHVLDDKNDKDEVSIWCMTTLDTEIITGDNNGRVKLWNPITKKVTDLASTQDNYPIACMAKNSTYVVIGSASSEVIIWNLSKKQHQTIFTSEGVTNSIVHLSDHFFYLQPSFGTTKQIILDAKHGTLCVLPFSLGNSFSKGLDDSFISLMPGKACIRQRFDLTKLDLKEPTVGIKKDITGFAFPYFIYTHSGNNQIIEFAKNQFVYCWMPASGDVTGYLYTYNATTKKDLPIHFKDGNNISLRGHFFGLHLVPNGYLVMIYKPDTLLTQDYRIAIIDMKKLTCVNSWRIDSDVCSSAIFSDGRIVTGDSKGQICIWELQAPSPQADVKSASANN